MPNTATAVRASAMALVADGRVDPDHLAVARKFLRLLPTRLPELGTERHDRPQLLQMIAQVGEQPATLLWAAPPLGWDQFSVA